MDWKAWLDYLDLGLILSHTDLLSLAHTVPAFEKIDLVLVCDVQHSIVVGHVLTY